MWYSNLGKKNNFSTYPPPTLILSHRFTSASKPAAQKSFGCCLSHFRTPVSTSSPSAKRLPPSCVPLHATDTLHRKQETFLYEHPSHLILLSTTLLFGSTLLKHGRHFDYWNQTLNMRVCWNCHEAGLYCYLAVHKKKLLHPLQLGYLHVWPIYWLFLSYFILLVARTM
jgi:hypothetical protein